MSAAGGVGRAVERAVLHGCETLQLFSKNNARWEGKPIDPGEAVRFREAVAAAKLTPVVAHASYLINLAAPPGLVRRRSIAAMIDELERARMLGLLGVVLHPGTAAANHADEQALDLVGKALQTVFAVNPEGPMVLIEHTAGQGRTIGHSFEHLAGIIGRMNGSPRIGICLDTCHLLAAGYDIASDKGYADTIARFSTVVGLDRLRVLHANDSKRPLGSRVDRHEHIGQGFVGLEGFRRVVRDRRLGHLGLMIETHKTKGICDDPRGARLDPLDVMNLDTLRGLRDLAQK